MFSLDEVLSEQEERNPLSMEDLSNTTCLAVGGRWVVGGGGRGSRGLRIVGGGT